MYAVAVKSLQSCLTLRPHRRQPTRLCHPSDSPGKNTGVRCHCLLQCMKVKSESEVTQSCLTLASPWTAAFQAPPSMGFSKQEYQSGVPLPSLCPHPRDVKINLPVTTRLESSKAEIQPRHSSSNSVLLTSAMHSYQPVREGPRT